VSESLYVYAVVRSGRPPAAGTGIDGRPLRSVATGPVAAVVHDHDDEPYGGPDDEVRRRALEHNRVVEALWGEDRAVLPMSFDVIVAGTPTEPAERRLAAWLEAVSPSVEARLGSLTGRVELRVDLALDPVAAAAAEPSVVALRQEAADASPGVERLLRKRVQRQEREIAERRADALYPRVRERLARLSADLVENPRAAAEPGEVLVLSVSLLVDEAAVPPVGAELRAVGDDEPAARIRFYGPWPPYSFADVSGPSAAAAEA
jgi:hypothetical protein